MVNVFNVIEELFEELHRQTKVVDGDDYETDDGNEGEVTDDFEVAHAGEGHLPVALYSTKCRYCGEHERRKWGTILEGKMTILGVCVFVYVDLV